MIWAGVLAGCSSSTTGTAAPTVDKGITVDIPDDPITLPSGQIVHQDTVSIPDVIFDRLDRLAKIGHPDAGWQQTYLPPAATMVAGLFVIAAAVISGIVLWKNNSRSLEAEKEKTRVEKKKADDARTNAAQALAEAKRVSDGDVLRRDRRECFDRFVWAQEHENEVDLLVLSDMLPLLIKDAKALQDDTLKGLIEAYNARCFDAMKRRYLQAKGAVGATGDAPVTPSGSTGGKPPDSGA